MKFKNKLLILLTSFSLVFALNALPSDLTHAYNAHADGDWSTTNTKVLAHQSVFLYDASDTYLFFSVSPNDYSVMSGDFLYTGSAPNYNVNDYNFLTYIQLSHDNETYIPFSTIYNTNHANYFFKDGTFRFGLRHNIDTIEEDGSYEYIKVLEGCEFPSYDYCVNGGTKTKYVQKETTISKLNKVTHYEVGGVATWEELHEKRMVTYTGIAAGWNNAHYGLAGYNQLIISFGQHNVDFLADNHLADSTNRATDAYDIGRRLTINGLPIYKIHDRFPNTHVGYDHGFAFFYVQYPVEVLLMNKNNMVPTLHIEAGTEFMDVRLPETNLQLIGGSWVSGNNTEFKLNEPLDLILYSYVEFPKTFGSSPLPVFKTLPSEGAQVAFNMNTGNIDPTNAGYALRIDGFYNTCLAIYPTTGRFDLEDKAAGNAIVQQFTGLVLAPNTDYLFEIEVVCGTNTTFKFAINHCLVLNYTFTGNRSATPDVWVLDTSGCFTIDLGQELESYQPIISNGGSSSYDFIEGDEVYNFAGVINAFDLYDDSVGYANLVFTYQDGAVTDNKYNAGVWTLTISLTIDGYETVIRVITINVHGKTGVAKIYYDDAEPIEVPVGSKLVPPPNPDTYREGEFDYVFDGWYFEGAKWDFENDFVQGDMHLVSKFVPVSPHYIVTVKYEGIPRITDKFSLTKGSVLPFELFDMEGATFEVYLNDSIITSLVVQGDMTITVKYTIVFSYVEAVEATCTEDGNLAYYYSAVYPGYYFADPEGRELMQDVILPKLNHDIVHLEYKDSTCSELGNVDCYYCKNCHKHFTDENAEHELVDWSIAKKPHVLTHHEQEDATCENDGYIEHWTCENEPGVYYGNEECTVTYDNIVIPAIGHDYRAPTYTWRETNDGYECVASIICTHCHDEISETKVATKLVLRESTCTQEGQIAYSVSFDDLRFNAQTKIVTLAKAPHTFVHVDEIPATKDSEGVAEHYECSECHKVFIKDGDEYKEVNYSDLFFKYKSSGCAGNIAGSAFMVIVSAGAISVLLMIRRKEER